MTDENNTQTGGFESATEKLQDQFSSRRRFMAGTAAVGAGGLAAASSATADEHGGGGDDEEATEEEGEMGGDEEMDDVDILNFALKLEYLEARFYQEGLDTIGQDDLTCSQSLKNVGGAVQNRAFDDLRVIQEHEETHVDVIASTIEDLGGEPRDEPEFDFGTATEDPDEFLATAAVLETTGVGAYAGAAPLIQNADLIPPALSIHSVEARHSSFLNVLTGEIGFPNAFDEALTIEEVDERAGPFIVQE